MSLVFTLDEVVIDARNTCIIQKNFCAIVYSSLVILCKMFGSVSFREELYNAFA
jgi:hypothetical protein